MGRKPRPETFAHAILGALCLPKAVGGLAMRSSRMVNAVFMLKIAWELFTNKNSLWVQVLKSKYKWGSNTIPKNIKRNNSSNCWKGVTKVWNFFLASVCWKVRDGGSANFWEENWLPSFGPLIQRAMLDIEGNYRNWKVKDVMSIDGCWNRVLMQTVLPNEVCEAIFKEATPSLDKGPDIILWNHEKDGRFSTKSAYRALLSSQGVNNGMPPIFKLIWHWQGPERIRFLL